LIELRAALHEMDMRVVKPGQHQFPARIDDFCLGTAPQIDFRLRADKDDSIPEHSDRFGFGVPFIHGVNGGVPYDQRRRWLRLSARVHRSHKKKTTNRGLTFHNGSRTEKHLFNWHLTGQDETR
jgi:hypothetical protein